MSRKLLDPQFLEFIDAYLLIHESISHKVMRRFFGLSKSKISRIFKVYQDERPSNMRMNQTEKVYKKGFVFTPVALGNEDPLEYLNAAKIVFRSNIQQYDSQN